MAVYSLCLVVEVVVAGLVGMGFGVVLEPWVEGFFIRLFWGWLILRMSLFGYELRF